MPPSLTSRISSFFDRVARPDDTVVRRVIARRAKEQREGRFGESRRVQPPAGGGGGGGDGSDPKVTDKTDPKGGGRGGRRKGKSNDQVGGGAPAGDK